MGTSKISNFVIPAKAGIQRFYSKCLLRLSLLRKGFIFSWIPAFAGMTVR
jgi:hypothetical protein